MAEVTNSTANLSDVDKRELTETDKEEKFRKEAIAARLEIQATNMELAQLQGGVSKRNDSYSPILQKIDAYLQQMDQLGKEWEEEAKKKENERKQLAARVDKLDIKPEHKKEIHEFLKHDKKCDERISKAYKNFDKNAAAIRNDKKLSDPQKEIGIAQEDQKLKAVIDKTNGEREKAKEKMKASIGNSYPKDNEIHDFLKDLSANNYSLSSKLDKGPQIEISEDITKDAQKSFRELLTKSKEISHKPALYR